MKINYIKLKNFGSYEGEAFFDTTTYGQRNIIVFGGKNGSGKTTLFNAVAICLYGCLSMGYKSNNSYYIKRILKLINENAKRKETGTFSYVELNISIPKGNSNYEYALQRSWNIDHTLTENFTVSKQNEKLNESEIADFEKYIQGIIPPELFNLYFFDGEKIADFFMEEKNDKKIKEAFLTLCGYDIFEIMKKNFKRLSKASNKNISVQEYFELKEKYDLLNDDLDSLYSQRASINHDIVNCDADINKLEKDFQSSGGITEAGLEILIGRLKAEEHKRSRWNIEIKREVNEVVPFLMVKPLLLSLEKQINRERTNQKYADVLEVLSEKELKGCLDNNLKDKHGEVLSMITQYVSGKLTDSTKNILDLSLEQMSTLSIQIGQLLEYDSNAILTKKKMIKRSISKSAKIREEIEAKNVELFKSYLKNKERLLADKQNLIEELHKVDSFINQAENKLPQFRLDYQKAKTKLEMDLKSKSISDIATKSIIMLENLQSDLYMSEIQKVEKNFMYMINSLMYKKNFIDEIKIDNKFNVHLYRKEVLSAQGIYNFICEKNQDEIRNLWGEQALKALFDISKQTEFKKVISYFLNENNDVELPIELNKDNFSSGEKQIYIMSLYYSIMMISSKEMPFIIDTPFARIDMNHRLNISRFFFSKLKGQVFILSTDEEIDSEHIKLLSPRIAKTYLLENNMNQKTVVTPNKYFEV